MQGAAYVFRREGTQWVQEAHLLAGDGQAYDGFGYAVAIHGDYLAVAALLEDEAAEDAGAVYVFRRDGTTWIEMAKLVPPNGDEEDYFGYSLAINNTRVVVGVRYDDDGGPDAGAAWVFRRADNGTPEDPTDDTWQPERKLRAADADQYDEFGSAVALAGTQIAVGAYRDEDPIALAGSVYIFELTGANWTQTQKLHASDPTAYAEFGRSVALTNDYLLVGAPLDSEAGYRAGAAYVFAREGSAWTQRLKLSAADVAPEDQFGNAVAINGNHLLVGAWRHTTTAPLAGAAYLFRPAGAEWVQDAKLTAGDAEEEDLLGSAVDLGPGLAVLGAPGEGDLPNTALGAVYTYTGMAVDCNGNDHTDACDLAEDTSLDCNATHVPDECEAIANGDFDADADVDLGDFRAFHDCLGGPGVSPTPTVPECVAACLAAFDADLDDAVSLRDFSAFHASFGQP